jgi:uncharacterized membrane protein
MHPPPENATYRRRLAAAVAALAFIGFLDALYLAAHQLSGTPVACGLTKGCDAVLGSNFASWGGIPLAAVGAAYYFSLFALATLERARHNRIIRAALAVIAGAGFAASLGLTALQAFVIRAACAYCLFSALLTTAIVVLVTAMRRDGSAARA